MDKLEANNRVLVFKKNLKKENDRKAQLSIILASKTLSEIIRTTLGPRSMLKMLLDPLGGIVITNDGNSILREIDVSNPGAKTLIELSRNLNEEVGDGTTSCVILCGEILGLCAPLISRNVHPIELTLGLQEFLSDALAALEKIAVEVPVDSSSGQGDSSTGGSGHEHLLKIINSCLSTKLSRRYDDLISKLALDSVLKIYRNSLNHNKLNNNSAHTNHATYEGDVDIKRLIKVEKVTGGLLSDSSLLNGVMINKDVTHAKMARRIENPRILILDCALEYKKNESQTVVDIHDEEVWNQLLLQEEREIRRMCDFIVESGCNLLLLEKGVSDLAQHYLVKANVSVIRRVRKSDTNRISKAVGATIVNRPDEIEKKHIGHDCRSFYVSKIGDEYYSFFDDCVSPRACSIVLRGSSKDVLNELERNLYDALNITRNVILNNKVLPGGGATEIFVANHLNKQIQHKSGLKRLSYEAACKALEVIPKTLIQNCGLNSVKLLSELYNLHENGRHNMGVNGDSGELVDVLDKNIFDLFLVKSQVYKSAVESACMLLRIDIIVSGINKRQETVDEKIAVNEEALEEQA